jgi:NhaP-type Na+/H+ or K+/H+ antiporter
MDIGFVVFVVGIALVANGGVSERHIGNPPDDLLKLLAWGLLFSGLIIFLLGLLQSSIRRE